MAQKCDFMCDITEFAILVCGVWQYIIYVWLK